MARELDPQHTAGPWLAAAAVSSVVGLPVVKAGDGGGRLICNVNCAADPLHGKVAGDDAFNREALANARLIAAAPELLAALRDLLAGFESYDNVDAYLGEARAAIAKAVRSDTPPGPPVPPAIPPRAVG